MTNEELKALLGLAAKDFGAKYRDYMFAIRADEFVEEKVKQLDREQKEALELLIALHKEASERDAKLFTEQEGVYEAKIDKILSGIEEIADDLEGTKSPDADEARFRLRELVERIKEDY